MRGEFWVLVLSIISTCCAIVVPSSGKMARSAKCISSTQSMPTVKQAPASKASHPKPVRLPCVNCVNSPSNRQCWGKFNIDTDYYQTTPDTGITREVWRVFDDELTFSIDSRWIMPRWPRTGFRDRCWWSIINILGLPLRLIGAIGSRCMSKTILRIMGIPRYNEDINLRTAIHWHGVLLEHNGANDRVP